MFLFSIRIQLCPQATRHPPPLPTPRDQEGAWLRICPTPPPLMPSAAAICRHASHPRRPRSSAELCVAHASSVPSNPIRVQGRVRTASPLDACRPSRPSASPTDRRGVRVPPLTCAAPIRATPRRGPPAMRPPDRRGLTSERPADRPQYEAPCPGSPPVSKLHPSAAMDGDGLDGNDWASQDSFASANEWSH